MQAEEEATQLHDAAVEGDLAAVRRLIGDDVQIDAPDAYGATALYKAAKAGHDDIVEFLLSKGADVNARTALSRSTPLHQAAKAGYTEIARQLIEHDADVNARDHHQDTPLCRAAEAGNRRTVELLLANGADARRALSKTTDPAMRDLLRKHIPGQTGPPADHEDLK